MALDAKKYLHSDEMHEDDSVFDPGGKQEYTEEQLIRFAEMWAIIKLKALLQKLRKQYVKESVKLVETQSDLDGVKLNAVNMPTLEELKECRTSWKDFGIVSISDHISYNEAIHSATALRMDINNVPGPEQLKCMMDTAEHLFEPLREWVKGPIKVTSMFRGEELNTAVGGSATSQHCKDSNGQTKYMHTEKHETRTGGLSPDTGPRS
mgnify:CR=1 FL=1